jgi:hypothetical protein
MREIALKAGISKERVRQILARNLGSTRHEWLSTLQLCIMTGLPRNRVLELQEDGVITPACDWNEGKRHYLLWSTDSVKVITAYFSAHHTCHMCNKPLPKNRMRFCSDGCRQESHKYKYMTDEEKNRVLVNIRRYRERKRQALQIVISPSIPVPVPVLV